MAISDQFLNDVLRYLQEMYSAVPGWKIEKDKKIDGQRAHFFLTNKLSSLKVVVQAKEGPTVEKADVELLAQLRDLTKADRATLCHQQSAKIPPEVEAFAFQKGLELRPIT